MWILWRWKKENDDVRIKKQCVFIVNVTDFKIFLTFCELFPCNHLHMKEHIWPSERTCFKHSIVDEQLIFKKTTTDLIVS